MDKGNKQNRQVDSRSTEVVLGPRDDYRAVFHETRTLSRGVTVRPEGEFEPVFQGIHDEHALAQAILTCFEASPTGKVILTS